MNSTVILLRNVHKMDVQFITRHILLLGLDPKSFTLVMEGGDSDAYHLATNFDHSDDRVKVLVVYLTSSRDSISDL